MLKILTTLLMLLCVTLSVRGGFFVFENFEDEANLVLDRLLHAEVSNSKPLSGKQHLLADRNTFSAAIPLLLKDAKASKILVSCHVDPRGKATRLDFKLGSATVSVQVDPQIFGYRQVIAEFPLVNPNDSEITITSSGNAGTFTLDDLQVSLSSVVLCERPEPTQILSNWNGENKDLVRVLRLDGNEIATSNLTTGDGYLLLTASERPQKSMFVLGIQPEDEAFNYAYGIWADIDQNGVFTSDERIALISAKGSVNIPIDLGAVENGLVALRVRMLDPRSNDMSDAYSGKTWGQSIDLIVDLTDPDPEKVQCQCENPDYYLDLSGKKLMDLENAPAGMYLKVSGHCTEKIVIAY